MSWLAGGGNRAKLPRLILLKEVLLMFAQDFKLAAFVHSGFTHAPYCGRPFTAMLQANIELVACGTYQRMAIVNRSISPIDPQMAASRR
jgi:hypothetical protein